MFGERYCILHSRDNSYQHRIQYYFEGITILSIHSEYADSVYFAVVNAVS